MVATTLLLALHLGSCYHFWIRYAFGLTEPVILFEFGLGHSILSYKPRLVTNQTLVTGAILRIPQIEALGDYEYFEDGKYWEMEVYQVQGEDDL